MSRPKDLFRSLVRSAADEAKKRALNVGGLGKLRESLNELVQQRLHIPASTLTSVVAHLPGVVSASVTVTTAAIAVDVDFDDGRILDARLIPTRIRFAPRGAKEISFRVEPVERSRTPGLIDVISALSGAIATTLWPLARGAEGRDLAGAVVERDGPDAFTVDLRTVPRVRAMESTGAAALVTEVVGLGELLLRDGALVLQLRLPQLVPNG